MQDWIITKRHLGFLFLAVGLLGFVGLLALDLLQGKIGNIGPSQQLALAGCFGLALIGLTLIPLGDRPA
jgi:hypothetical protein